MGRLHSQTQGTTRNSDIHPKGELASNSLIPKSIKRQKVKQFEFRYRHSALSVFFLLSFNKGKETHTHIHTEKKEERVKTQTFLLRFKSLGTNLQEMSKQKKRMRIKKMTAFYAGK